MSKFTTKDSHTSLPRSCSHDGPNNPRNKPQTIPKRKRNSRSKGLSNSAEVQVDGPRPSSGQSVKHNRTSRSAPWNTDGPWPPRGQSDPRGQSGSPGRTVRQPRANSPTNSLQPKTPNSTDRNKGMQKLAKNTMNNWLVGTSRKVRRPRADSLPGAETTAWAWPPKEQTFLPFSRSPESAKGLLPNHRWRWSASRRCYAYKFVASNPLNRDSTELTQRARVPTEILQSKAEFGVWGIMIKHKDARGNYPWFSPTNPNPNTSESKEQATHKNPTKIARKRNENHTSYKREIDATMKASIQSEVRFFTNREKI
jgi:hypothetical protein